MQAGGDHREDWGGIFQLRKWRQLLVWVQSIGALQGVCVECSENRIWVETAICRGWPCFQAVSDTIFPDTFEQKKKRKAIPLLGPCSEIAVCGGDTQDDTFPRTYGGFRWPCRVAQDQTPQGALDVGISLLS